MKNTRRAGFEFTCVGAAACIVVAFVAGCPPAKPTPPAVVDAGVAKPTGPVEPKRPPYPNMATAAWGQRILEQRVGALKPDVAATSSTVVLDALHEMSPGSEQKAADLAAAWWKVAPTDVARGEAVALLALCLALDPAVDGYKDRLTDAYGLAAYASSLDASSSLNQSARVVVGASAGAVEQAKRLLEVVETTPGLGPEPRFFMALGQKLTGGKLDAVLDDDEKALSTRPKSARARALLAELYLDVGLYPETISAASAATSPWLDALRGRALVLDGKVDEGVALLKSVQDKLDMGRRGDALYWLGRSLTQKEGSDDEVKAIATDLGGRPGYKKESAVLTALLAQKHGDYTSARAALEPLLHGAPIIPVDVDATWLLVDACAGLGDMVCVDKAGARVASGDDDYGRLNLARAAAALVGKSGGNAADALKEAHRASPFDPQLAKKVGDAVVDGGPSAANRVRAARRAAMRKSPKLVKVALTPLEKTSTCRVCRALYAMASTGVEAAGNGAKALAGAGPPLCVADVVAVVNALGAAPIPEAVKALDAIKDDREPVKKAIERARADHKDPDARRRRDAGEHEPEHAHGGMPGMPDMPPGTAPPPPTENVPVPAPAPGATP